MPKHLIQTLAGRGVAILALLVVCCVCPASAEDKLVGVVIDFQPRKVEGRPTASITHNGEIRRVREHDLIYEGDTITFDPAAGPDAFIKALVDHQEEIKLDPSHPAVPAQRWPLLQSLMPKLLVATRWVNAAKGGEDSEVRNALSREVGAEIEDLSVLPHAGGALAISQAGSEPVWIAWKGGLAPFTVALSQSGMPELQVKVCGDAVEKTCSRETAFADFPAGDQPLTLKITSADGKSWSKAISRVPIAWDGELSDLSKLGALGVFLRATELLDRDSGQYVLESARELAAIAPDYPPARTLLNRIKAGRLP